MAAARSSATLWCVVALCLAITAASEPLNVKWIEAQPTILERAAELVADGVGAVEDGGAACSGRE